MHEDGGWDRTWRGGRREEALGSMTPFAAAQLALGIKDFMMPATVFAGAMKSYGFGKESVREFDPVKIPGCPAVENFAERKYEFLRNTTTASARREHAVHEWLNPILNGAREELRGMALFVVILC